MVIDDFGVSHYQTDELCKLLYQNPDIKLDRILVDNPDEYNNSVIATYADFGILPTYHCVGSNVEEFDHNNQKNWLMPDEYKQLDIVTWLIDQCKNDNEVVRISEELLLYQDRNLFPLLQYCKYLVDTFRKNNIVWGVGRGSSVASYVLYKIGIHKIDSLKYDLPIVEFLK